MRIVMTGALGHIGSRLVRSLQPGEFDDVTLIDNLSSQRLPSLFDLPPDLPCRFVEADVRTADLDSHFAGAAVVVHLAAAVNAVETLSDEARVGMENVEATRRVVEACARQRCRLFLPSTTSAYGAANGNVDEDAPAAGLERNPYAASKVRIEQMLSTASREAGLRYCVGRCGTIFGPSPGMRFDTAINRFCWQASVGQPVSVWRTAMDQVRPYLDLEDAVRAVRFVIQHDLFDGRAYNLVTVNTTVREVVDLIREHVPEVQIAYVDSPIMNRLSYSVSTDRFRARGFEFRGDLRAGIQRTLALLGGLRQSRPRHDLA